MEAKVLNMKSPSIPQITKVFLVDGSNPIMFSQKKRERTYFSIRISASYISPR